MVAPATRKPRRSSRGHEKGVAYISAGPAKATAPGWTKRVERKPSTVIRRPRRPGRCSSLQPPQGDGAFPRCPLFHELYGGEQFRAFSAAICGQGKEFTEDKRAEMWRAALPKLERTY